MATPASQCIFLVAGLISLRREIVSRSLFAGLISLTFLQTKNLQFINFTYKTFSVKRTLITNLISAENSDEGGVLWGMEIKESNETARLTSAELYGSSGSIEGDTGSSFLIFALVFASIAVAGFVAFMRYRDVSEQNWLVVDRTVSFFKLDDFNEKALM